MYRHSLHRTYLYQYQYVALVTGPSTEWVTVPTTYQYHYTNSSTVLLLVGLTSYPSTYTGTLWHGQRYWFWYLVPSTCYYMVLPGRIYLDSVPAIIHRALSRTDRINRANDQNDHRLVWYYINRTNDHTVLILVPIGGSNSANSTHSQNRVTFWEFCCSSWNSDVI